MVLSSYFFCLGLFLGLHLCFGLLFFGLLRFLLCLFLHEQYGFLFLDALVTLFVNLVVPVLDVGKFFGHVLLCKVKQEGCNGIAAVCVLEIGNQKISADNGFLLAREVSDDVRLFFLRKRMICLLYTSDAADE